MRLRKATHLTHTNYRHHAGLGRIEDHLQVASTTSVARPKLNSTRRPRPLVPDPKGIEKSSTSYSSFLGFKASPTTKWCRTIIRDRVSFWQKYVSLCRSLGGVRIVTDSSRTRVIRSRTYILSSLITTERDLRSQIFGTFSTSAILESSTRFQHLRRRGFENIRHVWNVFGADSSSRKLRHISNADETFHPIDISSEMYLEGLQLY